MQTSRYCFELYLVGMICIILNVLNQFLLNQLLAERERLEFEFQGLNHIMIVPLWNINFQMQLCTEFFVHPASSCHPRQWLQCMTSFWLHFADPDLVQESTHLELSVIHKLFCSVHSMNGMSTLQVSTRPMITEVLKLCSSFFFFFFCLHSTG